MLSLNVRTPVHENNHTSHRVQDPSLIRISQQYHNIPPLRNTYKVYGISVTCAGEIMTACKTLLNLLSKSPIQQRSLLHET